LFGIDFPELIVILVIALILFGPEKLPEYSQKMGQMVYKWKRAYTNLQRSMYLPPELTRNMSASDYAFHDTQENFCSKCGHRISGDFVFCPACGQRVHEASAEPVPAAQPTVEVKGEAKGPEAAAAQQPPEQKEKQQAPGMKSQA
jgi:TatA/E family protein of Tat protein translocase